MSDDTSESTASPYERLGGASVIRAAVAELYRRLLADPALAHYFAGVDLPRVERHQVRLVGSVLGGPQTYTGRALGQAHRGLGITPADYDRVIDHLTAVLREAGADDDALAAAAAAVAGVRPDIVEVPAGG